MSAAPLTTRDDLSAWSRYFRELHSAVTELERTARPLDIAPLSRREWYELLIRKLLPQLSDDAFLVVAVVGGTNIGKSVIFNHLAGFRASASTPVASGTKHPTLLTPPGFAETHDLAEFFPGFAITAWHDARDALQDDEQHRLFVRTAEKSPPNLLLLDTPDIDSDVRINWQRADDIRHASDVLVAVLTQQKYNDAAVKEFFRKAAAEDKATLLVFNQVLLPEDEAYWPAWIDTFCRETGIRPLAVLLAPNDRRAAEDIRLPFFERSWPVSNRATNAAPATAVSQEPRNLMQELSKLRFGEIKIRTMRGSMRQVLDEKTGIAEYLDEIEGRSAEFRGASELLSAHQLAEIDDWPSVPSRALVNEVRNWWSAQREGWSRGVHNFYNVVGRGITWPFRKLRDTLQGEAPPLLEEYRHKEWSAMLEAVEKVFDKLTWLAELGHEQLRPRLAQVLAGSSRARLIETLREKHAAVDLNRELADLVTAELANFRDESPGAYDFFRKLDMAAAAARPATSVVLFITGFGPVGHAITPALTDTALQGIVHVAGDVAGGTVAAAVGDTVISGSAATGAAYIETKFRKLHAAFTGRRAKWLGQLIKQEVLGSLPEEMQARAEIVHSPAFRHARDLLMSGRSRLNAEK